MSEDDRESFTVVIATVTKNTGEEEGEGVNIKYKLDAESRKLRALESHGGPGLSAFECSEDATKGPQGALKLDIREEGNN